MSVPFLCVCSEMSFVNGDSGTHCLNCALCGEISMIVVIDKLVPCLVMLLLSGISRNLIDDYLLYYKY